MTVLTDRRAIRNPSAGGGRPSSLAGEALQLLVLGSMALAQPLFDLIGRQPEFLAVRRLDTLDVLLFVALPMLLPCALVLPVTALAGLLSRRLRQTLHSLAVTLLSALVLLPIFAGFGLPDDRLTLGLALLAGLAWARTLVRSDGARAVFGWLSLLLIVVPALFLSRPGVRAILASGEGVSGTQRGDASGMPSVVMLLFDELAMADLVDERGVIDGETFPNFARLAARADWFPGHQTVADGTTHAVPAILTGRRLDDPQAMPILADHPVNLFTLLAPTHALAVHESASSLCPPSESNRVARSARLVALALDAGVVWARVVLPDSLTDELPDVTTTWGGFVQLDELGEPDGSAADWLREVAHELGADRAELFETLLAGLAADEPPTLHYLHVLLPHSPLEYLPQGASYSVTVKGILDDGTWGTDAAAVDLAWQRHLLQLAFADRELGRVVDRLDELGLFDTSLIVVSADHGASFRVGNLPRAISPSNLADILPVPLMIKRPGQSHGVVREGYAETVDILPTMLELLDIELPAAVQGHSLVSGAREAPDERRVLTFINGGVEHMVPGVLTDLDASVQRRQALFPRPGQQGLFAIGDYKLLLDRDVADLPLSTAPAPVRVGDPGLLQSSFSREATPRVVHGRWIGDRPGDLVLAVNGTIRATTRCLTKNKFELQMFTLFVPESALRERDNRLALYVVASTAAGEEDTEGFILQPAGTGPGAYVLREQDGQEWLIDPLGKRVEIVPTALRGWRKAAVMQSGEVAVSGWAYDIAAGRPAQAVVVFEQLRFLLAVEPDASRPSLVEVFGEGAEQSGFRVNLQGDRLLRADASQVRVFAVSTTGQATELGESR